MWEKLSQILVSMADKFAYMTASIHIWGEEEMPECLRETTIEEE